MSDARFTIMRVRTRAQLNLIRDYLLHENDYDDESFFEALMTSLQNNIAGTYILLALENMGDTPVMFIIALKSPQEKFTFIQQTWAVNTLEGTHIQDQLFCSIILWAKGFGCDEIRMETQRCPEAFARRWGFKPISTIMSYDISPDLISRLVEGRHSELIGVKNVELEQTKNDEHPDGGATEHIERLTQPVETAVGTRRSTLPGESGRNDDADESGGSDPE